MSRSFRVTPALVISIAVLVAAGCGSSSKSNTTATSPAASAPATPSTPITPTTSTTGGHAYPAALKSNFLKGCEGSSTAAKCECALSYVEAHTPLPQFIKEEQELQRTHTLPASLSAAVQACKTK